MGQDKLLFSRLLFYEDNHICLVYKPAGMLAQGDKSQDLSLLDYGKIYLKHRYNKPGNVYLSLAHRLDRPVAGLCVLAKTTKAMQRLSRAFQNHDVEKYYLAIVEGLVEGPAQAQTGQLAQAEIGGASGKFPWFALSHYLRKNGANNKSFPCKQGDAGAKLAQLRYCAIVQGQNYSIVAIRLDTGRHHQIRCQLAAIGHPVRGDLKYGAKRSNPNKGVSLYAFALQVPMPVPISVTRESNAKRAECNSDFVTVVENNLKSICLPWQAPDRENPIISLMIDLKEATLWKLCGADVLGFLEAILE